MLTLSIPRSIILTTSFMISNLIVLKSSFSNQSLPFPSPFLQTTRPPGTGLNLITSSTVSVSLSNHRVLLTKAIDRPTAHTNCPFVSQIWLLKSNDIVFIHGDQSSWWKDRRMVQTLTYLVVANL